MAMTGIEDEFLELRLLREAFPQLSLKAIIAAYNAADGAVDAAAAALEQQHQQQLSVSSDAQVSSPGIASSDDTLGHREISPRISSLGRSRSRKWTTVARSGTVSSVRACSDTGKKQKKKHLKKKKNAKSLDEAQCEKNFSPKKGEEIFSKEQKETLAKQESKDLEEFLLSMLGGDEVELGMDVVRDVIYECQGDGQKSLDSLLAFMSSEGTVGDRQEDDILAVMEAFPDKDPEEVERIYKEHGSQLELATKKFLESDVNHLTKGKESSYQVLATEIVSQDGVDKLKASFPSVDPKTLKEVLKATNNDYGAAMVYLTEAGLKPIAQEFVENVFKPPEPPQRDEDKESEWIKVKPKAPKNPSKTISRNNEKSPKNGQNGRGHTSAVEYWSIMRECFLKATVAYANGHRSLAGHLSEKGREYKQLAIEARGRESKQIFRSRNKFYSNNITIDLHDQHVDEALRIFNLHLAALKPITSVHTITVITGCGHHAANGKPKLKPAIISYMNRKGLKWSEINPGCLIVDIHC